MHASGNSPPETVGLSVDALGTFRSTVLLYVGTTGNAVLGDLAEEPMFKKHVGVESTTECQVGCFPHASEGRVFGMIYVEAGDKDEKPTADQFESLQFVTNGLAPILDRFSMQKRLQRNSRELQEESKRMALSDAAKAKFAHFVPKTVRREIENDPFLPLAGTEPKDISAGFMNVENFTVLSSRKSASDVAVRDGRIAGHDEGTRAYDRRHELPPVEAAAWTPVANCGRKPLDFIKGMVITPVEAVLAPSTIGMANA